MFFRQLNYSTPSQYDWIRISRRRYARLLAQASGIPYDRKIGPIGVLVIIVCSIASMTQTKVLAQALSVSPYVTMLLLPMVVMFGGLGLYWCYVQLQRYLYRRNQPRAKLIVNDENTVAPVSPRLIKLIDRWFHRRYENALDEPTLIKWIEMHPRQFDDLYFSTKALLERTERETNPDHRAHLEEQCESVVETLLDQYQFEPTAIDLM